MLYEIESGTAYLTKEAIDSILAEHDKDIKHFAYILHNNDVREDGTNKSPHWHIMLKLNESRRRADIASWFSLEEKYIQDSKSGKYDLMVAYLIHLNAPEKYQYETGDIYANFSYEEMLNKVKGKLKKKSSEARINEIIELIASGTIREYNINDFITVGEYDKYKTHIKNAFEYRSTILEQQNTRAMEVIYIYGSGGTGKSTYAETIAKNRGLSYKRSASERDPLGSYKGQDAFVLDDVRGDTFKFQDWMAILDNFQDRAGSSRFRDRHFTECKVLFLTSTVPPDAFWKELSKERKTEDPHQFYRRVKTVIHMTEAKILCKRYDEATHSFGTEQVLANNTFSRFSISPEDETAQKEKLANSLGVDKSLFNRHIEVEELDGVLPTKTTQTPQVKLLDDSGANRFYLVAEGVSDEVKAKIVGFANHLI